jgi:hypothetical protein
MIRKVVSVDRHQLWESVVRVGLSTTQLPPTSRGTDVDDDVDLWVRAWWLCGQGLWKR